MTPRDPGHTIEAIVIGGSAGGIDALLELLPGLPADYPLPIVVVLHLPDERDSLLANIFALRLDMPVREAADKEAIAASTVYFAGSGYHLSIEADRSFSLSCEPPLRFSRPSIDILMESAADAYGTNLLGILLTGANDDGAAGLCRIQQRGGMTIVQDPSEAQVATMPAAALDLCIPDGILKLRDIRTLLLTLDHRHAT
ncbi:chemotaxis protein CheB [Oxalicibacterium solurbis]|uniref:protein-glutamate methylesterase n=1 Tax=Oxalicibacterium solurbis TaxID=69280 RepID=A0A8J3B284_9BURK|nr:chemotaxis protein CheB [Oxalicibacterium solurbis]GGI53723.1 chemotaxis protein CheB [Oxalicibacterium solurbis]